MDASALLAGQRIVPVVVIEDAASAAPLAETLLEAGLGAIEVTLRSDAALAAIERIAAATPELVLGAGSVRRAEHLAQVREAGARFAVSPGATTRLLDAAEATALPFVPGAVTASEMMRLRERGYSLQKFFPAELSGGVAALRALAAPLPEVRFFPTGGITAERARDYLAFDAVACLGGSWMVPAALLGAGDYTAIGRLAGEAARLANGAGG